MAEAELSEAAALSSDLAVGSVSFEARGPAALPTRGEASAGARTAARPRA